ncbi:RNA polymerase sigma factor [Hymenobacter terrenus]|uniref:RNA polymerase sigma factor n=1 Tax=Hymenobacter terrenus TaxID=1629124 RepID=UPI0006197281|nr:hypothetical protein [Hymenobacter terrenus]
MTAQTIDPDNQALADLFMNAIAASYDKRWKRFEFQLAKYQLTRNADAENVFTDTLLKCQDRITRAGLPTGSAFATYFDRAVENNLLKFLIKHNRDGKHTVEIEKFSNSSEMDITSYLGMTQSASTLQQFYPLHPERLVVHPDVDFDDPQTASERQHYEALVKRCLFELPAKYQDVLTLVVDGMRYWEIRRTLGLTKDQVKMRILVARRLMREKIALLTTRDATPDFLELDEDETYC